MGQSFQYFDLSENDPFVLFVSIIFFEFFDGNQVSTFFVAGFEDYTVLSLSDLVKNFVFIHG